MDPDDPVTFHVDLTSAPALVASDEYYLDVSASGSGGAAQWLFHSVDQISPGSAFFAGADSTTSDFWFKTSMLNPVVVGGCVVDQENDQPVDGQVPLDVIPSGTFNDAQEFILSASGDVVVVDVEVVSESGSPSGNLIVRIYDDTQAFVEVEGTVPIPALSANIPQIISVSMPPNFLVGGDTYSIDVSVDTASDLTWARNSALDTYPPGVSFSNGAVQSVDYNFAICVFFDTASLVASVNILKDCGLITIGFLDYGSLIPNTISLEQQLDLQATGSADVEVLISGDDWLDALFAIIMDVGRTHYFLTSGAGYGVTIPLTASDVPLDTIPFGTIQPTFWQLETILNVATFSGFLNQDIFLTFICQVDFLIFTSEPTFSTASTIINPGPGVVVEVQDASFATLVSFTGPVTISIDNDPSAGVAVLGGTTTVNAVAGIATFNDLTIDTVGAGYTLIVEAEAIDPAISLAFDIT